MLLSAVKLLIPNRPMPTHILFGPFRGARIRMNPRDNLRKIFGLYEHELNEWLTRVLPRVDIVLDVGANNGYFAFGCAAALRRLRRSANVVAFEPQPDHCALLQTSLQNQPNNCVKIAIEEKLVGKTIDSGVTTLDAVALHNFGGQTLNEPLRRALIKIDVEGSELDVIAGASAWLRPRHFFVIEVHEESYVEKLKRRFADADVVLELRSQRPLPFLGGERRSEANWWLTSRLD
jgi:hypothetical protein